MARASTFTSYVNSQLDPNASAAYRQLEAIANRAYDNIGRRAAAASRAGTPAVGRGGAAGTGGSAARSLDELSRAQDRLVRSSTSLNTNIGNGGRAFRDLARDSRGANDNLAALGTTLNVIQGPLGPIAGRVRSISQAVTELSGLRFGLAAAGAGLFAFGAAANSAAEVRSKLAALYETQNQVNAAFDQAVIIANRSRASLGSVVDLYAKLTQAGRDYGISQREVNRITETATKAAALSGGRQETRDAAIYQFSQGLSSNKLGGDELRSILEGAPQLGRAIAEGLSQIKGFEGTTLGSLRRLGAEGKLTADVIAKALGNSADAVDERFARLPVTIGAGSARIGNAFTQIIGNIDQAVGATSAVGTVMISIADNMRTLIALSVGLSAAFFGPRMLAAASAGVVGIVTAIEKQVQLTAAVRAGNAVIVNQETLQKGRAASAALAAISEARNQTARIRGERSIAVEQLTNSRRRIVQIEAERAAAVEAANAELLAKERVLALNKAEQADILRTISLLEAKAAANTQTNINQNVAGRLNFGLGVSAAASAAETALLTQQKAINAQLVAEKLALQRANLAVAVSEAEVVVAQRAAIAAASGSVEANTALSLARQDLARATLALTAVEGELVAAKVAETAATEANTVAQRASAAAQAQAAASTGLLAGAMNVLKFALPLIAITALVTAVTYLATAESNAARSAREMADAQNSLGKFVDFTTGKIKEQNSELVRNRVLKANERLDEARNNVRGATKTFLESTRTQRVIRGEFGEVTGTYGTKVPEAVQRASDLLLRNRISLDQFNGILNEYAKRDKDSADLIRRNLTGIIEARQPLLQAAAEARVLSGQTRPGDLQLAEGDFSGALNTRAGRDVNGVVAKTPAQIMAEAKALSARTDLQRAQADLNKVIADGAAARKAGTYDEQQYTAALTAAVERVQQAKDAQKALTAQRIADRKAATQARIAAREEARDRARETRERATDTLNAGQQDLEERRPGISRQQYLDERIKLLETYDAEVNAIDDNAKASNRADRQRTTDARELGAALRDITRSYETDLAVQALRLRGMDNEAEALGRTLDLVERVGDQGFDQYQVFLRQIQVQEQINTRLEERSRIIDTLQGGVDTVRDSLETFLNDAPKDAARAGRELVNSLSGSFRKQGLRLLTDQLLGGADQKVKDLISGRSAVERQTNFAVEQFSRTGTAAGALAQAFDAARSFVLRLTGQTPPATGTVPDASPSSIAAPGQADVLSNGTPLASLFDSNANVSSILAAVTGLSGAARALTRAQDRDRRVLDVLSTPGFGDGIRDRDPFVDETRVGLADIGAAARTAIDDLRTPAERAANQGSDNETIVVTAARAATREAARQTDRIAAGKPSNRPPTLRDVYNETGRSIGDKLDKTLGTKFLGKLGGTLGTALAGASEGAGASSLVGALGIKQNQTGASIGGAIGGLTGLPGGAIIGGLLGGTLGNFVKGPTRSGYSSISTDAFGNGVAAISGGRNSDGRRTESLGYANDVLDSLKNIASSLNGTIKGGQSLGTIGTQGDKFVFDSDGAGPNAGIKVDTLAEAQQAAIANALQRGIIDGISEASKRILAAGGDLSAALEKATAIENIPRRLLQRTDPARFAVEELNKEFTKLISYLKEGGASAAQLADAEKLYDLERADAIKNAMQGSAKAISDYLRDITAGASSPLSRGTVYRNASDALKPFEADIRAGKAVDSDAFLTAIRNYQDASRTLNGSGGKFFSDFDLITSLLNQAKKNQEAAFTDPSKLPASPFASKEVQDAISGGANLTVKAIDRMAGLLAGQLDRIIAANENTVGGGGTSIGLLAGTFNAS